MFRAIMRFPVKDEQRRENEFNYDYSITTSLHLRDKGDQGRRDFFIYAKDRGEVTSSR